MKILILKTTILLLIICLFSGLLIGCKKVASAPIELINFISADNINKIGFEAWSTKGMKEVAIITDKSEVKDIVNKINKEKFIRHDSIENYGLTFTNFDNSKLSNIDNQPLNCITIRLYFIHQLFENDDLALLSSSESTGVDISLRKTTRGADTLYINPSRDFLYELFNKYAFANK